MSRSTAAPLQARVSRVFLPLMVLLTAFLVLTASNAAQAQNQTVMTFRGPITPPGQSLFVWSESANEAILIEGEAQLVMKSSSNPDGSYSQKNLWSLHGTGVGLDSGTQYVFNQVYRDVNEYDFSTGYTNGYNIRSQLISQGDADNEQILIRFLMTQDQNGNIIVNVDEALLEVRG